MTAGLSPAANGQPNANVIIAADRNSERTGESAASRVPQYNVQSGQLVAYHSSTTQIRNPLSLTVHTPAQISKWTCAKHPALIASERKT